MSKNLWTVPITCLIALASACTQPKAVNPDNNVTGASSAVSPSGLLPINDPALLATAKSVVSTSPLSFHQSGNLPATYVSANHYISIGASSGGLSVGLLATPSAETGLSLVATDTDFTLFGIKFIGSRTPVDIQPINELPYKSSYYLGSASATWQSDVPNYSRIRYLGVYSGIDVDVYGVGSVVQYDFIVAPGADPSVIRIGFEDATSIRLEPSGELAITVGGATVIQRPPHCFQEINGEVSLVSSAYILDETNTVRIKLGDYSHDHLLTIDPQLDFSSYLGGASSDESMRISIDPSGQVFVAGYTMSTNFPGASGSVVVGQDGYLVKVNMETKAIAYTVILGGAGNDFATDVSVDPMGDVYITGVSQSDNFPTMSSSGSPLQATRAGGADVFVTKLSNSGALIYSTYFGGLSNDLAPSIAAASGGRAYLAFATDSAQLATTCCRTAKSQSTDAFVAVLNQYATALDFATYLGGTAYNTPTDVAVGPDNTLVVAGHTTSTNFPTSANAVQRQLTGSFDIFVAKVTPISACTAPNCLQYATYLGGSDLDFCRSVAVSAIGDIVLAGDSTSTNFPIQRAYKATKSGTRDGVVAKIANDGALSYSTYFGGSSDDYVRAIAVDSAGRTVAVGSTSSSDFPQINRLSDPAIDTGARAFVFSLSADGTTVDLSSTFGGTGTDDAYGIAVAPTGDAYVVGQTASANFPTINGLQFGFGGGRDGFLIRVRGLLPPLVTQLIPDVVIGSQDHLSYEISQFFPAQGIHSYGLVTGPHGLALDTESGRISFKPGGSQWPAVGQSAHVVTVLIATNDGGTTSQRLETFHIGVQ